MKRIGIVLLLTFAFSCGARTELPAPDGGRVCAQGEVVLPVVRSPECDASCSPPCVPFRVTEYGCNGTCVIGRRDIACYRHAASYFEVNCLEHTPTGTLFVAGDFVENIDDPQQIRRVGYKTVECNGLDDGRAQCVAE